MPILDGKALRSVTDGAAERLADRRRKSANGMRVNVIGAGVLGLWQALTLARRGFAVSLLDASEKPLEANASRYAGAMLAPDCEAEAAPDVVRDMGRASLEIWKAVYPNLVTNGSLVVASARDAGELARFSRQTQGHTRLDGAALGDLEPGLEGRFHQGLLFPAEAHMSAPHALSFLLDAVGLAGCRLELGHSAVFPAKREAADWTVDCRGLGARGDLPGLRGVRGERVLIRSREVALSRPVRLLHPRHSLYVVPWPNNIYMVGATVIESEDDGPASVRSVLELLGAAYALHPGFAEAEIVDVGAGVRPAFADNVPRAYVYQRNRMVRVNGAYRHGFLLAPVLAAAVADFLTDARTHGVGDHPLLIDADRADASALRHDA